jgi:SAM-dependent methyltransferase
LPLAFDSSRRVLEPEALDTEPPAVAQIVMRDLVRINTWLGGRLILPSLFRRLVAPDDAFTVLDIGAGSGDVTAGLRRRYPNATVTSLDRRPEFLEPAAPPRVAADAFCLPFRERSFDFVTCSLFLHHFPDEQIAELIAAFRLIARRAVIAVDLERNRLAYEFIPATRWLFRWHDIGIHDSQASVQAGFSPEEFAALVRAAGAADGTVRRHRPWFRLSAIVPAH